MGQRVVIMSKRNDDAFVLGILISESCRGVGGLSEALSADFNSFSYSSSAGADSQAIYLNGNI